MQISQIHYRAFLIFSFICAIGCGAKPVAQVAAKQEAVEETSVEVAETPESKLDVPLDKSLMLEDYVEAGVPPCDRAWTGAEMAKAAAALSEVSKFDPGYLPRYKSERSGMLFDRLVSLESLEAYRDQSLPVEERLKDALVYFQSGKDVLVLYDNGFNRHAVGDSEVVEVMGYSLRMWMTMNQLMKEMIPTLDRNDPTYPIRMEGVERFRNGLIDAIGGNLDALTESKELRSSELKRLIGHMNATFPELIPELPQGARTAALSRLREFQDNPDMQHLQPELDELVAIAEKAAKANAVQGPAAQ
jgi:hypothetical protein